MSTEKLAPPECCPICGAGIHETDDNAAGQIDRVWFVCGATWAMYRDGSTAWKEQCPHAMTACLRTSATLHPTAREQARDALVAADLEQLAAYADLLAGAPTADKAARRRKADAEQRAAARAYLATVTP